MKAELSLFSSDDLRRELAERQQRERHKLESDIHRAKDAVIGHQKNVNEATKRLVAAQKHLEALRANLKEMD